MDEILSLDGGRGYGLLTRAQGKSRGQIVILLNAGLIHRPGPFRFHVHLARELSRQGLHVFRFDQPRVGDAAAGSHATADSLLSEVMDALRDATGVDSFIVGGICSAADQGWSMAVREARVSGVLLIDGMAVRNYWFKWGQLALFLKRPPGSWLGMLGRFLKPKNEDAPGLMDFRDWSDPASFQRELAGLLARKVRILALYTGGISYYLLHPGQLRATFGASRRHPDLQVEYWPDVDHILLSPVHRDRVIAAVNQWCVRA